MLGSSCNMFSSVLVALLLASTAQGQLSISQTNLNAIELFETIFGPVSGIQITNAQRLGSALSFGTFDGGDNVIGISSGVVLSNGDVVDGNGPNSGDVSTDLGTDGDPDLPTPNNDAAVLLIDFQVVTPIEFTIIYVFASDEYDESIFSFPDPFGIFVDGQNVALTEDGLPIDPSNVNCGSNGVPGGDTESNCGLFVSNESQEFDIEYDGFVVPLIASSMVLEPGPHSLKFAIADISDGLVDSAAFLTGNVTFFEEEPAMTVSDPHVQGFNGQHFDFDGELGREYAFISAPNLQMNVRVEEAYASGVNIHPFANQSSESTSAFVMQPFHQKGTWVTDVGLLLKFGDGTLRTIEIHAKAQSVLQAVQVSHSKTAPQGNVLLDNVRIPAVGTYPLGEESTLTVKKSKSYTRITIFSKTHFFNATIDIVSPPKSWTEKMMLGDSSYFKLWHLNFAIHELGYANRDLVHGVVGQTVNPLANGLEGEESDYLLQDGLLGHQFSFDKFEASATTTRTNQRRVLNAAPTKEKSVLILPEITPSEFTQLRDLELSYKSITALTQSQFSDLFHVLTQDEYGVFNQFTLGEAAVELKANMTTKNNIISDVRYSVALLHYSDPSLAKANPVGLRDIIQRLVVALYKPDEQ